MSNRPSHRRAGFTLLELLVVLGIVGILAALSYPQYTDYLKKTRRSEIAGLLSEEAHRLERFYSRTGQYSDLPGPPALSHEVSAGNGFYRIDSQRSAQVFVLNATPSAGTLMAGDECGIFVIDNTGRRDNLGLSGEASVVRCWGR